MGTKRDFAMPTFCFQSRKSLGATIILLVVAGILYLRGTLDASSIQSNKPIPPFSHNGASEILSETSALESFKIRQKLGTTITNLFNEYQPPLIAVNQSWMKAWPPMLAYQTDKQFNPSEIGPASEGFFLAPDDYTSFNAQQRALQKAIPTWNAVKKGYSGRGIVISAGAAFLARVWPNVVLMLRSLDSTLPIEVWTKDRAEYDRTLPLVNQMRADLKIAISVHTVVDYMSPEWSDWDLSSIFKVKALALLFSSFEEVVLCDADSIPVIDPEMLFDSKEARGGLIQWPDFWSNSVSKVLHDAYEFDYSMNRTTESGQLLINKRLQFEPLVLSTYYNWFGPPFFYKLINMDSMGAGDKDTFWLGSAAYHRDFHVVERGIELITAKRTDGSLWNPQTGIFNGAMGQFNPGDNEEVFFMHMHAPKVDMNNELYGDWDLVFFHPLPSQNVKFRKGEQWLERKMWENLMWVECDSIMRNETSVACQEIKLRVLGMMERGEG